jgi:cellulose synthase/poly-beta-1,6-N-acetylglucosamine synthase-like glycosyltransferase
VAVFDADERPQPAALRQLVQPFIDRTVGGVSGRRAVSNSLATPAAGYTTFEGLVHQFITLQAKDRLNLAPALLGANCAYRREALRQLDGFQPGALLEDTDLTVRLARAGWRTRFAADAISRHRVPQTVSGYWRQHTRWARGFNDVARAQGIDLLRDGRLSLPLRLELLTFALGYLDRLALLAAGLLVLKQRWLALPLLLSLFTPLLQIVAALKLSNQPPALWARIGWVPLFFGLDAAMAVTGAWNTLRRAPRRWENRWQRQ